MTQPKHDMDSSVPQESIQGVADAFTEAGYPTIGHAIEGLNPDNDPTNISGEGTFAAENVAQAIAQTTVDNLKKAD